MTIFHRKFAAQYALAALLSFVFAPMAAVAQVAWVKGFDAALQQAAKEKKFIILDISASY